MNIAGRNESQCVCPPNSNNILIDNFNWSPYNKNSKILTDSEKSNTLLSILFSDRHNTVNEPWALAAMDKCDNIPSWMVLHLIKQTSDLRIRCKASRYYTKHFIPNLSEDLTSFFDWRILNKATTKLTDVERYNVLRKLMFMDDENKNAYPSWALEALERCDNIPEELVTMLSLCTTDRVCLEATKYKAKHYPPPPPKKEEKVGRLFKEATEKFWSEFEVYNRDLPHQEMVDKLSKLMFFWDSSTRQSITHASIALAALVYTKRNLPIEVVRRAVRESMFAPNVKQAAIEYMKTRFPGQPYEGSDILQVSVKQAIKTPAPPAPWWEKYNKANTTRETDTYCGLQDKMFHFDNVKKVYVLHPQECREALMHCDNIPLNLVRRVIELTPDDLTLRNIANDYLVKHYAPNRIPSQFTRDKKYGFDWSPYNKDSPLDETDSYCTLQDLMFHFDKDIKEYIVHHSWCELALKHCDNVPLALVRRLIGLTHDKPGLQFEANQYLAFVYCGLKLENGKEFDWRPYNKGSPLDLNNIESVLNSLMFHFDKEEKKYVMHEWWCYRALKNCDNIPKNLVERVIEMYKGGRDLNTTAKAYLKKHYGTPHQSKFVMVEKGAQPTTSSPWDESMWWVGYNKGTTLLSQSQLEQAFHDMFFTIDPNTFGLKMNVEKVKAALRHCDNIPKSVVQNVSNYSSIINQDIHELCDTYLANHY